MIIRHIALKNGQLFRETYVGHDAVVTASDGLSLVQLLLFTFKKLLGSGDDFSVELSTLRNSFGGIACDGNYIQCNISDHMASELLLPVELVKDTTT